MPARRGKRGPQYFYWDSNVFLAYVQDEGGRVEIVDELLKKIGEHKESRIITSAVTIVEVAFATYEKDNATLDPKIEDKIDKLLGDESVVVVVEAIPTIMRSARNLMRQAIAKGNSLKPADAIQLATAQFSQDHYAISVFHTYEHENKRRQFSELIGIPVEEPELTDPIQQAWPEMVEEKDTT